MQDVILSPIPLDRLKETISYVVKGELTRHFENRQQDTKAGDLLTRKEAAKFLGISLPTLLEFTKAGKVTGYRIGTRVRYKRSELEKSLQQIQSTKSKRK